MQTHAEVKVNPNRADVVAFIRTITAADVPPDGMWRFHAGTGGKAVMDLKEIARVGQEAADAEQFVLLSKGLSAEQVNLVEHLGDDAWERAGRIEVVVTPQDGLEQRAVDLARALAGTEGANEVREFVRDVVARAAGKRGSVDVGRLIAELRARGAYLHTPATTEAAGVDDEVIRSLLVLQHCEGPLEMGLLASIVGCDAAVLASKLQGFVAPEGLCAEPPTAMIVGYPSAMHRPEEHALLERALQLVMAIGNDRSRRSLALQLLRTLRRLTVLVDGRGERPDLVARVYPATDKVFKTAGDHHLALEVASLSFNASYKAAPGTSTPSEQMMRDRAQTLICGHSWVHQRTGNLQQADLEAQSSLELGEKLGWGRNTAFCMKCIGRLRRLQALATDQPDERARLFRESVDLLERAGDLFSSLDDFGPRSDDVGDCRSLLARTYLAANDPRNARRAVDEALNILVGSVGTKDWADAMIVDAEVTAIEGDAAAALRKVDEVMETFPYDDDADATEIAARALRFRATLRARVHPAAATADLLRAADLYERLRDPDRAAEVIVESWRYASAPVSELSREMEGEAPLVQVAARRRYDDLMSASKSRSRSQRVGAPRTLLRQLVVDARADAARLRPQW